MAVCMPSKEKLMELMDALNGIHMDNASSHRLEFGAYYYEDAALANSICVAYCDGRTADEVLGLVAWTVENPKP